MRNNYIIYAKHNNDARHGFLVFLPCHFAFHIKYSSAVKERKKQMPSGI